MKGDGEFVTTLHWVQQNGAGGFARFFIFDHTVPKHRGRHSAGGIRHRIAKCCFCLSAGRAGMVNLFDLAKTVADFGHQIGFVGADAGEVAAGSSVDTGGRLSTLLQDFATARGGRLFLPPPPAFMGEVVFSNVE